MRKSYIFSFTSDEHQKAFLNAWAEHLSATGVTLEVATVRPDVTVHSLTEADLEKLKSKFLQPFKVFEDFQFSPKSGEG